MTRRAPAGPAGPSLAEVWGAMSALLLVLRVLAIVGGAVALYERQRRAATDSAAASPP